MPELRIAYALVPEALVGAFVDAKHAADGHTALLSQGVLACDDARERLDIVRQSIADISKR